MKCHEYSDVIKQSVFLDEYTLQPIRQWPGGLYTTLATLFFNISGKNDAS